MLESYEKKQFIASQGLILFQFVYVFFHSFPTNEQFICSSNIKLAITTTTTKGITFWFVQIEKLEIIRLLLCTFICSFIHLCDLNIYFAIAFL